MTTLDLLSDDLIESEAERGLGFFDWILRMHASLHNAHALHARYKRRAHLPTPDSAHLRLRREYRSERFQRTREALTALRARSATIDGEAGVLP